MKKGLIGCLAVGLVLLLAGAGAAYWFVLRPMWSAGSAMVENAQDMAKIADSEKSVSNQSPYSPPADGKLTPAQAQSFVAVQTLLTARMGKDFDTLKQKYDAIDAQHKKDGKDADLGQVMGAYSDLSALMLKAHQAQVEGVNQQHLSLEEYRWIRQQAYAAFPYVEMTPEQVAQMTAPAPVASSMPAANASPEAQAAAAQAQAAMQSVANSPEVQAAKANAELLRPYKEVLEKTLGAAWLGI